MTVEGKTVIIIPSIELTRLVVLCSFVGLPKKLHTFPQPPQHEG